MTTTTVNRALLVAQVQQSEEELESLRAARAALPLGDRERAQNLRQQIARARDDLEEAQADLRTFDEQERSAERQAERARGREARTQARVADDEARAAWRRLEDKLREATAAAHEVTRAGRATAELAGIAIAAHYGRDQQGMHSRAALALPAAAGHEGAVVQALAFMLRDLIQALPCAHRLTVDYFAINGFAFSVGRRAGSPRDPLELPEALAVASETLTVRLAGLCEEPAHASEAT